MIKTKSLVSLLAISALIGTGALPTSAEDLKKALAKAYQNNPTLLAQREALKASDEQVAAARSGYRPSLSGSASYARSKDSGTSDPETGVFIASDTIKNTSYSLSASQTLFAGFRVKNADKSARASVKAARAQLLSVEQSVLLDAATAYMDVIRDMAVLELNQNQVKVLTRNLQASQDRFQVGESTRTDVAQSEARLEGAKSNLRTAEAGLSASTARYRRVIGEMPKDLEKPKSLPELPVNLDDVIEAATEFSPAIQIARYNEQAAAYNVKSARGSLYPTVSLGASYSRSQTTVGSRELDPTSNRQIGVSVSVPLYAGGATYSSIRQAKRLRSQRMLLIQDAERQATESAFVAWDNLRAATAVITSTQAQVRANEIALEGVRQESAVGSRTTLEVLNAEQELLNAQVSLIRAQRDEFVASYNLLATMGKLTARSLNLGVTLYDPTENYDKVKNKFFGG